jgi:hypothetical protein
MRRQRQTQCIRGVLSFQTIEIENPAHNKRKMET